MSQVIVGRWGKNLAVRVPSGVANAAGLNEGEKVEVELVAGDIVIRRPSVHARARRQAEEAAAEIRAESKRYSLGGMSIRELREEGRRG
jgi:antitoxin MazE